MGKKMKRVKKLLTGDIKELPILNPKEAVTEKDITRFVAESKDGEILVVSKNKKRLKGRKDLLECLFMTNDEYKGMAVLKNHSGLTEDSESDSKSNECKLPQEITGNNQIQSFDILTPMVKSLFSKEDGSYFTLSEIPINTDVIIPKLSHKVFMQFSEYNDDSVDLPVFRKIASSGALRKSFVYLGSIRVKHSFTCSDSRSEKEEEIYKIENADILSIDEFSYVGSTMDVYLKEMSRDITPLSTGMKIPSIHNPNFLMWKITSCIPITDDTIVFLKKPIIDQWSDTITKECLQTILSKHDLYKQVFRFKRRLN